MILFSTEIPIWLVWFRDEKKDKKLEFQGNETGPDQVGGWVGIQRNWRERLGKGRVREVQWEMSEVARESARTKTSHQIVIPGWITKFWPCLSEPYASQSGREVRLWGTLMVDWCGWSKGFPCGSAGKESTCNAVDLGLIPGLGRSSGEGKG